MDQENRDNAYKNTLEKNSLLYNNEFQNYNVPKTPVSPNDCSATLLPVCHAYCLRVPFTSARCLFAFTIQDLYHSITKNLTYLMYIHKFEVENYLIFKT